MRQIRRIGIFTLFGLTAVALLMVYVRREPSYQGRTLTSWLKQCSDAPLMEKHQLSEAQEAVRAIGVEKALPTLMRMVEARDGPARLWAIKQTDKLGVGAFKMREAEETQQLAIAGFEAFETNAAAAVPELTRLLKDPDFAFTATRCLIAIGTPAETGVAQALTNKSVQVRCFAVQQFGSVTDDTDDFLAHMEKCLSDRNGSVRSSAVEAIGRQTHAPESAIPLLLRAMRDNTVSARAAQSLAGFGTNASRAIPDLIAAVEDESPNTAREALIALVAIDPKGALPIVFDNFRSQDPRRRRTSFDLLWKYPATNSEVQSAIQQAVADPYPNLAYHAKELITKKYRAEHPLESQLPNEPADRGKNLGDWLKANDGNGDFPAAAKEALLHMGTNAIPALIKRLVYAQPPFGLPAYDVNIDAVRGLIALGEGAKPALPQLQLLMESTNGDIALHAMVAACGTGTNAIPLLIRGLTNRFASVRGEAANYLAQGVGGRYREQTKAAIPLFERLLNDPDEDVRLSATNEFKEFDPVAAAKLGLK